MSRDNRIRVATVRRKRVIIEIRVPSYPGFAFARLAIALLGTAAAMRLVMQQLVLEANHEELINEAAANAAPTVLDDEA